MRRWLRELRKGRGEGSPDCGFERSDMNSGASRGRDIVRIGESERGLDTRWAVEQEALGKIEVKRSFLQPGFADSVETDPDLANERQYENGFGEQSARLVRRP